MSAVPCNREAPDQPSEAGRTDRSALGAAFEVGRYDRLRMPPRRLRPLLAIVALAVLGLAVWSTLDPVGDSAAPRAPAVDEGATRGRERQRTTGPPPVHAAPDVDPQPVADESPDEREGETLVVSGRVLDLAGEPVAGARVTLSWIDRPARPLGGAATDDVGRYRIEAPEFAAAHPLTARASTLVVAVEAAGHFGQRRIWRDWPQLDAPLPAVVLDFELEPGRRLLGRVVDGDGAPVAGAHVRCTMGAGESSGATSDARTRSGADGRFCFALRGVPRRLSARSWRVGIASRAIDARGGQDADIDVGDVALRALGTLAGRAVLPDRSPAARVLVVAAEVDDAGAPTQARQHDAFDEPDSEVGLPVGRCVTDEHGRWRMAGLAPGSYVVYALPRGGTGRLYAGRPVDTPHPAGSRGIEVVVDFPRLVVELVDPAGVAVPRVRVVGDRMERAEDGTLFVADRRFGPTADDGTIDFAVRHGHSYRLTATIGDAMRAESLVEVTADGPARHVLRLAPVVPPTARLRVHVSGAGEQLVRRWPVRLLDPETGERRRVLRRAEADADGWWKVDPGIYDVEVEPDTDVSLDVYDALVAVQRGVRVSAGGSRELHLRTHPGGRFRLVWRAPRGAFPPGDRALPARTRDPTGFALFQNEWGARVDIRRVVADPDRQSREPWWTVRFAHSPQEAYHERRLLPDEEYRCRALLEPGRYSLRISCPGFEEHAQEIAIVPREETSVEALLEPR